MIKRIHVNQHHIKHNAKNPEDPKPVFTVKTSRSNTKGDTVYVPDGVSFVYSPDKPLSCGAKVWAETTGSVVVYNGEEVIDL